MYKFLLVTFLPVVLIFNGNVQAQHHSNDTIFLATAKKNAIKFYEKAMDVQAGIYSGHEYVEPKQTNEQNPFFITDDWQWGSVIYNGDRYDRIPLLYDIVSDYIITELFNGTAIVLVADKVSAFTFDNYEFEKINNETVSNSLPATGYYQIVYNGTTRVIARRFKRFETKIESRKLETFFDEKQRYYLLKDSQYIRVKNKRAMLKILEDEKSELRAFIRNQKIKVDKANPGPAYSAIANHYDSLKLNRK